MRRRWWISGIVVLLGALFALGTLLPRFVAIRPGLSGCSTLSDDSKLERCLVDRGRDEIHDGSVDRAASALDAAASRSERIDARCHTAAHLIAEPIGKRAARAHKRAPSLVGRANCSLGMAHGLMIGYLSDASFAQLSAFDPRDCAAPPTKDPVDPTTVLETCLHSLGHRLFQERADVTKGYVACEGIVARAELPGDNDDAARQVSSGCAGGLLMERAFDDASAAAMCPSETGDERGARLRQACISFLGINMAQAGASGPTIARRCETLNLDDALAATCGSGLATVITSRSACDLLSGEGRRACEVSYDGAHGALAVEVPPVGSGT